MEIIEANWPNSIAEEQKIFAFTTTRIGGTNIRPYDSFNVGLHVGDDESIVRKNRSQLLAYMGVSQAQWLDQIHGTDCVKALEANVTLTGDACWTNKVDLACVVMTADCLPVAFRQGSNIAVAHAGWRGLLSGVLENTLKSLLFSENENEFSHTEFLSNTDIWLGPAIGAKAFEIGSEVKMQFLADNSDTISAFTASSNEGKWLADIYLLAKIRLKAAGIHEDRIYGGEYCTFSDQTKFYSYRKAAQTGRMATVIYRKK